MKKATILLLLVMACCSIVACGRHRGIMARSPGLVPVKARLGSRVIPSDPKRVETVYVRVGDGPIRGYVTEQFHVKSNGALVALKPREVNAMVADSLAANPQGNFLYVTGYQGGMVWHAIKNHRPVTLTGRRGIMQFRARADGTLHPLWPPVQDTGRFAVDAIACDPQGKYVYVTSSSEGGIIYPGEEDIPGATVQPVNQSHILQYRVTENGALAPLSPPRVQVPGDPGTVAVVPGKPFA